MYIEPKLPRTYHPLIKGVATMGKRDIMPIDTPIHALTLVNQLQLHLPLPMKPTLFQLSPSRTMLTGELIMLLWRKPRMLQMLSLVYFFVNVTSTVVLFDYGASHSFITSAYVEKHNLPIALLKC
jgi:hypothetical protein